MRQFAVVFCFALIATAAAAAPGYKYQAPVRQQISVGNIRPQAPVSNSGIYSPQQSPPLTHFSQQNSYQGPGPVFSQPAPVQEYVPPPIAQPQLQQSYVPPPPLPPLAPAPLPVQQHAIPQQSGPISQPQSISYQPQAPQQFVSNYQPQAYQQQQQHQSQRPAIVTKDIYIHSAPEEYEDLSAGPNLDNVPVRKNYRIVFIKAPQHNLRNTAAALKRAQASNEEKTVIYVLSKKPDLGEIQQQLQFSQNDQKVHKPEVYFIKYKTQEEAARAQQEIQAQYDSLGGSTHISDEGIAPITTVSGGSLNLGSLGQTQFQGGFIQPQTQTIVQNGQQAQSFVQQQSFQSQSSLGGGGSSGGGGGIGSSIGFGPSAPQQKYLPAKTSK